MIDPSGMSQYVARPDSVFGPDFRPWIKTKRRLRAVHEKGAEDQTKIIIPKIKYMVRMRTRARLMLYLISACLSLCWE